MKNIVIQYQEKFLVIEKFYSINPKDAFTFQIHSYKSCTFKVCLCEWGGAKNQSILDISKNHNSHTFSLHT